MRIASLLLKDRRTRGAPIIDLHRNRIELSGLSLDICDKRGHSVIARSAFNRSNEHLSWRARGLVLRAPLDNWLVVGGGRHGSRRFFGQAVFQTVVTCNRNKQFCSIPVRCWQLTMTMTRSDLTILVIDENAIRASIIEEGLREAGHSNVTVVNEVNGVARIIETTKPDVIVIDLENPNRDMMEHLFQLTRTVSRPIAMFVDRSDTAQIEAAMEAGVSAYVVDGLKKERVKSILDMAVSRFNAFSRLQRELAEAKSALEERKVIERAKGILMKMRGLSEEDAFALLRQTAMNEKKKMSEIAQSVVTAAGLLMS